MQTIGSFKQDSAYLSEILATDLNFDMIRRDMTIAGRDAVIFFIDGFMKDEMFEKVMEHFMRLTPDKLKGITTAQVFGDRLVPYMDVNAEHDMNNIVTSILSGISCLLVEGISGCVLINSRTYPLRSISEPEKDKVMRGSRDGFVEALVTNTALIRRRIRDPHLCMEHCYVGTGTKLDVVISYVAGMGQEDDVNKLKKELNAITTRSISMTQEALSEALTKGSFFNPFPRIKYTERPDYAAACLLEGRIILIMDNTPAVMVLPCSIADFQKEANDYYFPPITGTYMRIIRLIISFATLLITPLFLLLMNNPDFIPAWLSFIEIQEPVMLPLIVQLLMLEFVIDGLRLASLNTPDVLSSSLGVIGGLILSEFAIKANWFTVETILYMAFVTIGSFAQPSYEMGYAIKFYRILFLILIQLFNVWGFAAGLFLMFITALSTKVISGKGYLYPIIPFNGKDFIKLFFRMHAQ